MKLKKIAAAVLAAFTLGGTVLTNGYIREIPAVVHAEETEPTAVSIMRIKYNRYEDHLELIDASAASGSVSIPVMYADLPITVIAENAFAGNEAVTAVKLSSGITSIGKGAFSGCTALSDVTFPEALTEIGAGAFSGCTSLESVTIPKNTETIGEGAFNCTIYGYTGSAAQTYAEESGCEFIALDSEGETASSSTTTKSAVTTTTTTTVTTTTTTAAETTTTTTKPVQGKPIFRISQTDVSISLAKKNNIQTVNIYVEGADKLYCNTGIYLYYDSKLTLAYDPIKGAAGSELTGGFYKGDTKDFVFLTTAGSANVGKDGLLWSLKFSMPSGKKVGDEYKFYIGESKYGKVEPSFTNYNNDSKGIAMQDHIFSVPAEGYIRITEDAPYSLGDINEDGNVTAVDASFALAEYALISTNKEPTFTDNQVLAADVNYDGDVTAVDASNILAYYAYTQTGGTETMQNYMELFVKKSE